MYHHAPRPVAPDSNAKWSIVPHETWTGSPRPRKASVASARIEPAITRTVLAKISGRTFGQDVRRRRSAGPMAPRDRIRMTNCRSRSVSTWERTMRAVAGQLVKPDDEDDDAEALPEERGERR